MKRLIIVHQWMSGAQGDWRPWLKREAEKLGYEVSMPEMPDIDTPVIRTWVDKLSEVVGEPDSNTYFIGHSIGCQTILRYLETVKSPVGGAVFIAGWFNLENLEDEEVARVAAPWINTPINVTRLKSVLPRSTLIISDNDPFGCFEENRARFAEIVTKIVVMPNAGHISKEDGFTELPEALSELRML